MFNLPSMARIMFWRGKRNIPCWSSRRGEMNLSMFTSRSASERSGLISLRVDNGVLIESVLVAFDYLGILYLAMNRTGFLVLGAAVTFVMQLVERDAAFVPLLGGVALYRHRDQTQTNRR